MGEVGTRDMSVEGNYQKTFVWRVLELMNVMVVLRCWTTMKEFCRSASLWVIAQFEVVMMMRRRTVSMIKIDVIILVT